jgi:Tetracyclin repressor-like, C-terminal domain
VFAGHGDLARASFARIPLGENALRGSEWMIGVMKAGGLPDQVIAYACDLLPLYAMAVAYEESLYQNEGNTPEEISAYIESMGNYFASLPTSKFPNVVALAGLLTAGAGAGDERFEFGLDVLVRGLAAMASSPPDVVVFHDAVADGQLGAAHPTGEGPERLAVAAADDDQILAVGAGRLGAEVQLVD